MRRCIFAFARTMFVLCLATTGARADMVITLGNDFTLAPGGTGIIDIDISYTGSSTSTDNTLADFGLELQISPVGTSTSITQFTASPDPYDSPNYVFSGQSFGSDNGIPFWSPPFTTTTLNDTIVGGDLNDSSLGFVTIPPTSSGTTLLLATVQFQAANGATVGDSFKISLVNSTSFTYFDGQTPGLPYSSSGGMIEISSVPEPSSIVMAAISGLGILLLGRLRRVRVTSDDPTRPV